MLILMLIVIESRSDADRPMLTLFLEDRKLNNVFLAKTAFKISIPKRLFED